MTPSALTGVWPVCAGLPSRCTRLPRDSAQSCAYHPEFDDVEAAFTAFDLADALAVDENRHAGLRLIGDAVDIAAASPLRLLFALAWFNSLAVDWLPVS